MYKFINLSYLHLMSDGDKEMEQTMLGMLLEEIPQELNLIDEALASKDWETIFQISHKMKTTFAFVGNEALTTANVALESAARNKADIGSVPTLVTKVRQLAEEVIPELTHAATA